jgi:hypothetical protein
MTFFSALLHSDAFPYRVFGIGCVVGLIALALFPGVYRFLENGFVKISIYVSASIVCLMFVFWSASYLFVPNYLDHGEPTVAVSSALLLRGQPIYPAWDTGQGMYGTIYGPVLIFVHAAVLFLSKNIQATKFAGIVAIWLALLFIVLDARRTIHLGSMALVSMGCMVLVLFFFFEETFWNRPEPFLLLLSALGVRALRLPSTTAAPVIGLLAGLAAGLKLHAFLYFVPVAVALLSREEPPRTSALRLAGMIFAVALTATLAPFLHPFVSLKHYLAYLELAADSGLSFGIFLKNLKFLAVMITPGVAIYLIRRPVRSRETELSLLALLVCTAITAVIAAKPGSGPWHLLPFLPPLMFLTLKFAMLERQHPGLSIGNQTAANWFFCLYICAFGPWLLTSSISMSRVIASSPLAWSRLAELEKLYAIYPEAEMGVSDFENYYVTFYRVIGVLRGTPVHFEIPFIMDVRAAGLGDAATEALVEGCKITEWILPNAGAPFSIHYPGQNELLSDKFRQDFENNYRVVFNGNYYNVWSCR